MPGQSLERDLLKAFREYIDTTGTKAYAYRNKQYRYQDQTFDLFIDSLDPGLYLAIEVKSLDADKLKVLYFSSHFTSSPKGHQIEREEKILELSGRNGFLAVEARRKRPNRSSVFFVPFSVVWYHYSSKEKGLDAGVITQAPSIIKEQGKYTIDSEFIKKLFVYSARRYDKYKSKWSKW